MASTYKTLGQVAPAITTQTELYTVPASKAAVISSILCCNRGTADGTVRIAVLPSGGSVSNENYIYYDVPVPAKDTFAATLGVTLEAAGEVEVYASSGDFSFSAFGKEIDV